MDFIDFWKECTFFMLLSGFLFYFTLSTFSLSVNVTYLLKLFDYFKGLREGNNALMASFVLQL